MYDVLWFSRTNDSTKKWVCNEWWPSYCRNDGWTPSHDVVLCGVCRMHRPRNDWESEQNAFQKIIDSASDVRFQIDSIAIIFIIVSTLGAESMWHGKRATRIHIGPSYSLDDFVSERTLIASTPNNGMLSICANDDQWSCLQVPREIVILLFLHQNWMELSVVNIVCSYASTLHASFECDGANTAF